MFSEDLQGNNPLYQGDSAVDNRRSLVMLSEVPTALTLISQVRADLSRLEREEKERGSVKTVPRRHQRHCHLFVCTTHSTLLYWLVFLWSVSHLPLTTHAAQEGVVLDQNEGSVQMYGSILNARMWEITEPALQVGARHLTCVSQQGDACNA